ncbi:MAG: hydrogenase, partial [Planctomycetes bacterium]|nr:hydrogenase [Planctomycetota bacterium]
ADTGDVFARAYVRWLEMQRSFVFVKEAVKHLGENQANAESGALVPDSIAVAATEAWRGEVVHVGVTDANSRFSAYKIVDPSFHNWPGLAFALRGEAISDFPLCNKSFNLSYCGHDL